MKSYISRLYKNKHWTDSQQAHLSTNIIISVDVYDFPQSKSKKGEGLLAPAERHIHPHARKHAHAHTTDIRVHTSVTMYTDERLSALIHTCSKHTASHRPNQTAYTYTPTHARRKTRERMGGGPNFWPPPPIKILSYANAVNIRVFNQTQWRFDKQRVSINFTLIIVFPHQIKCRNVERKHI